MKASLVVFCAVLAFCLAACPRPSPVPPTPDADSGGGDLLPDAGPIVDASDLDASGDPDADLLDAASYTCSNWCAHAAKLGCPAAKPTPKGASCAVVCSNATTGGAITWNLRCRIGAKTCAAADACEAGK